MSHNHEQRVVAGISSLGTSPLGEPLEGSFERYDAFGVYQAHVHFDGGAATAGERLEESLGLFRGNVGLGDQFPGRRSPELDVGVANHGWIGGRLGAKRLSSHCPLAASASAN